MKKIVVVTGGAGFIGSHLVDALVAQGYRVRVIDSFVTGSRENLRHHGGAIDLLEADVRDLAAVEEACRGAETVFHQAALASVPLSLERPLDVHAACATGTLTVLDAARRAGVRRVIYAGSSSCYGDSPWAGKRESDPMLTLSPYAAAKLAGEKYCESFWHSFRLETVVLRYFNVFGPRQDPDSPYSAVIPLFIRQMLGGQAPTVFGDGGQSRDFCFVENVVNGNLLAMQSRMAAGRTYNLACGQSITLLQLIGELRGLLGVDPGIDFEPARPGDIRDSRADISAATRDLGYLPKVSFAEGLSRSIAWYKARVDRGQGQSMMRVRG
jgi:UDP-glucose 4-epimerase